jgi:outer membrane murein-binding lipoprotein Lpp
MWFLSFLIGSIGRWLLIGAASAAILVGAYVWGRMDCKVAANVRHLEAQVDVLKRTLERRERIARADAEQAAQGREALERHDNTDRELSDEMQGDDSGCFKSPDTDRVRRYWP